MVGVMVEVEFGAVELARAYRHGRAQVRREPRRVSDEAVRIARLDGEELAGWALDVSEGGARVLVDALPPVAIAPGEIVTLAIGDELRVARVVWARHQGDTGLFGLENVIVPGEASVVDVSVEDLIADVA